MLTTTPKSSENMIKRALAAVVSERIAYEYRQCRPEDKGHSLEEVQMPWHAEDGPGIDGIVDHPVRNAFRQGIEAIGFQAHFMGGTRFMTGVLQHACEC